jgi:hypothetical protein
MVKVDVKSQTQQTFGDRGSSNLHGPLNLWMQTGIS